MGDRSLAAYLSDRGYPEDVAEQFLYPLGAAVWSLPGGELRDFPASAYIRFFGNHGQLKREQGARWMAFDQGSQVYVDAFRARFRGDIRVGTPVRATVSASSMPTGAVMNCFQVAASRRPSA